MRNKWKQGQRSCQPILERRAWVALALLGAFSFLGFIQAASAQTMVTRYLNMNSYVIPFETLVAPTTLATVSAFGSMKYNANVTTAHISWSAVADTDQYKLMLYDAITSQWNQIYNGTGQWVEVENLAIGVRYFSVIACGGGLCGEYSPNAALLIATNLDKDLDGIDDDNDLCLGTTEGATVSAAGCIPTTVDSDSDGITDDLDWCAGTGTGEAVNSSGCSDNQIDTDGDGIADYLDAYPHQNASQCTP